MVYLMVSKLGSVGCLLSHVLRRPPALLHASRAAWSTAPRLEGGVASIWQGAMVGGAARSTEQRALELRASSLLSALLTSCPAVGRYLPSGAVTSEEIVPATGDVGDPAASFVC